MKRQSAATWFQPASVESASPPGMRWRASSTGRRPSNVMRGSAVKVWPAVEAVGGDAGPAVHLRRGNVDATHHDAFAGIHARQEFSGRRDDTGRTEAVEGELRR